MKFLYNNKIFYDRRQELRRNQTEAEKIIWQNIRNRKINVLKFYRQFSIGPYILDFYCPQIKLAIEIDGNSHGTADAVIYDKERTKFLESINIKVVRFKNEEVVKNIDNVIKKVHNSSLTLFRISPLSYPKRGAGGELRNRNRPSTVLLMGGQNMGLWPRRMASRLAWRNPWLCPKTNCILVI